MEVWNELVVQHVGKVHIQTWPTEILLQIDYWDMNYCPPYSRPIVFLHD